MYGYFSKATTGKKLESWFVWENVFYIFIAHYDLQMVPSKQNDIKQGVQINRKPKSTGTDFEKEFCDYLKTELGYSHTYLHPKVTSKGNAEGFRVDIIAKRKIERSKKLRKAVSIACIISALITVFGFTAYSVAFKNIGLFLIEIGLATEIVSLTFSYLVNKYTTEYAWVECKDWVSAVPFDAVDKMLRKIDLYEKSGDTEYYFTAKYFVAKNQFAHNAKKHAIENGIFCYVKKSGIFVADDNWKRENELH